MWGRVRFPSVPHFERVVGKWSTAIALEGVEMSVRPRPARIAEENPEYKISQEAIDDSK